MVENKLINYTMLNGKKHLTELIFIKTKKKIQKQIPAKKFKNVFKLFIVNSSPFLKIKKIQRKKKNTIEFPYLLTKKSIFFYGVKNILNVCRKKKGNPFYKIIAQEIINSSNLQSETVKIKKDAHEQAFLKKKFANYRWF